MSAPSKEDLLAAVAGRLVAERTRLGCDIEAAAFEAGVDAERLAAAEAGEIALHEAELLRLADLYGVDVTAFFGGRTTPLAYLAGM